MSFDHAFATTVGLEGKYSNNPKDPGGETMYGITARVARANGYNGLMTSMPLEVARQIYRSQYWNLLRLDSIDLLSATIAEKMFDTAVNMGVPYAAKFLQRALNVLNRQGSDFPDTAIDGVIGPVTVAAMQEFLKLRGGQGEVVLYRLFDSQQAVRYIEIAEANPSLETFEFGWILNRI